MRKYLFFVIAVTVAVSGCTDDVSKDAGKGLEAVEEASESEVFTVKYTGSGFDPENIVIRKGDSVRWMDRSEEKLSITTEYDRECPVEGFSSCENVEKFTHEFNESGRYVYRNSQDITDQAVIKVQERKLR